MLHNSFDPGHNLQGRRFAVFVNRHQRAAIAVLAHDVGLRSKSIADMRHIAHVESRTVCSLYGKIIQLRNLLWRSIHFNAVLNGAELHGSGGENDVLSIDRTHNIVGREPVLLQLRQVQIHLDLAQFSPVRIRRCGAGHGREIGAQEVLAEIEQFLLRQSLAAQAQLNNGSGRCAIRNDQWGSSAGRHSPHRGLADGRNLCDCALDIRARPKEDFNDPQSVDRLGFHVLNVVDRGGDAALRVGDNPVRHVLGRHAGVEPHHRDDRNIDVRENISRRAQDGDGRQDQDDQRHHYKRIRTP